MIYKMMNRELIILGAMAVSSASVFAESAHSHHGAGGQKHEVEAHDHSGSAASSLVNKLEKSREQLNDKGLSLAGEYIYEYTNVLDGGINRGGSDRSLFVFDAEFDLETIFGFKGATIFAQYLHVTAENGGTQDTGDIQAYSNIESERSMDVLYELWYEQVFADGKYRFKVGKVDANTEFNFVDAAGGFANSSAGFSPTVFALPTYPNPAMSVNLFAELYENEGNVFSLAYGFYDGSSAVDEVATGRRGPSTFTSDDRSNDYFHILQAEQAWERFGSLGEGRLTVGGWYHSGSFEKFSGGSDSGTHGLFLTAEQRITQRSGGSDGGIFVFGQYGSADEDVSDVAQHVAAGLVTEGTFASRESDSAGVYVTYVDLSDDTAAGYAKNECAIDAYYTFQINDHFAIQPELQYIINPSGSNDVSNALVGGVRFSASF